MILFITSSDHLEQTNKVMVSPTVTVSNTLTEMSYVCALTLKCFIFGFIKIMQNAKSNEKCFLRSVGACLSVCEHGWVPDDRDFLLSRVRRETQGGFKTDSRHSACLSVAKIQDAFIAQQNCVVL